MLTRTFAKKLASDMLAHSGVAGIWDLHLAAVAAKEAGKLDFAASLIEIAEAAELLWAARETAKAN
jgi:hypothetical protein